MSEFNGIDVSRWQGVIDWESVAKSGIKNAIIKLGGSDDGVYKDKQFEYNYAQARANGIKVGVYWFTGKHFNTVEDGVRDAEDCIRTLGDKELDYPIYCDIEAQATDKVGITTAVLTFCGTIHDKYNRPVGIYGSDISGFKDRMNLDLIRQYPYISLWVARYGSQPKWVSSGWDIWQSSSSGYVPGIKGRVDTDVFKFGQSVDVTPVATTVQTASQVVADNMSKELARKMYELIKPYL